VEINDKQIGQNVARARGDMSQKELALAMRARGHKWSQATVWNVERGERPLRLSEASALSDILRVLSIHTFTVTDRQYKVFDTLKLAAATQQQLEMQVEEVLRMKLQLATEADELLERDESAFEGGDLDPTIRHELAVMPVELIEDLQRETLRQLQSRESDPGPFTQSLIDGLAAIRWTVDE
jgi:hypothetical protein